jgi:hypothetical protein
MASTFRVRFWFLDFGLGERVAPLRNDYGAPVEGVSLPFCGELARSARALSGNQPPGFPIGSPLVPRRG